MRAGLSDKLLNGNNEMAISIQRIIKIGIIASYAITISLFVVDSQIGYANPTGFINSSDSQKKVDALTREFDKSILTRQRNNISYVLIDDIWLPSQELKGAQPIPVTLWANGVIPIEFETSISNNQQDNFMLACGWWSAVSNVNCIPATNQINRVLVKNSTKNSSWIGQVGGTQELEISDWNSIGIIAHEIGHAMGMLHVHQQIDRDSYVNIKSENIIFGKEDNFTRVNSQIHTIYDFDSILHYPPTGFSVNGKDTIVPHDQTMRSRMGQRLQLSNRDMLTAVRMYGENLNRPLVYPVPQLQGMDYIKIAATLMLNNGIRLKVTSGPTNWSEERINICEKSYTYPEIIWQSVPPGQMVSYEANVNIKTQHRTEYIFHPPPPGRICP